MIEIYTKTICPFCHMAKQHLTDRGIEFSELLFDDEHERHAMYDRLKLVGNQRTVPQIFETMNGERRRIGGYNDLLRSNVGQQITFNEDF
jgi:glutaredoxin 3